MFLLLLRGERVHHLRRFLLPLRVASIKPPSINRIDFGTYGL
jgi:hypothetical protein